MLVKEDICPLSDTRPSTTSQYDDGDGRYDEIADLLPAGPSSTGQHQLSRPAPLSSIFEDRHFLLL
jgi:hypothetical protein